MYVLLHVPIMSVSMKIPKMVERLIVGVSIQDEAVTGPRQSKYNLLGADKTNKEITHALV